MHLSSLGINTLLVRDPLVLAAVSLFLLTFQSRADVGNDVAREQASQYHAWHQAALNGDVDEIDVSIQHLEERLEKHPEDSLAKVYLGSVCALRAKESFWGMTKLEYLKRAEKLMNEAVAASPEDPRVLMIRAISLYKLPESFDKRPVAITDFQELIPVARQGNDDLSLSERQAILYYAYLCYRDEDMSGYEQLKTDCHQLAANTEYGKLTQ